MPPVDTVRSTTSDPPAVFGGATAVQLVLLAQTTSVA